MADGTNKYWCGVCQQEVKEGEGEEDSIACDGPCNKWHHLSCTGLSDDDYNDIISNDDQWVCKKCTQNKDITSRRNAHMHWGEMKGQQSIKYTVMTIYDKVINWVKNIMPVPRGDSSEKFIAELSRLLELFNNSLGTPGNTYVTHLHTNDCLLYTSPSPRDA